MTIEPDTSLRRLGSGDDRLNGLASALNSAAHMQRRRRSLISSPSNNELTSILDRSKKNKHHHQRVSFSADVSVAVSEHEEVRVPTPQDETTRIISLPWRVSDGSRDIDGRYTGDINLSFQPHGRGTLRFDEGKSNITGQWRNGEFQLVQQKQHNSVGKRITCSRQER